MSSTETERSIGGRYEELRGIVSDLEMQHDVVTQALQDYGALVEDLISSAQEATEEHESQTFDDLLMEAEGVLSDVERSVYEIPIVTLPPLTQVEGE